MYLMDNLKKGIYLENTLTLISNILCQDNMRVSERFVSRGLLDLVVTFSVKNPSCVRTCMNILGNVVLEDTGNAEILLSNNAHKVLFDLLRREFLCVTQPT